MINMKAKIWSNGNSFHHFGQKRRLQPDFVIDAVVPVVRVNLQNIDCHYWKIIEKDENKNFCLVLSRPALVRPPTCWGSVSAGQSLSNPGHPNLTHKKLRKTHKRGKDHIDS